MSGAPIRHALTGSHNDRDQPTHLTVIHRWNSATLAPCAVQLG
jgi:hypothetical protein